MEKLLIRAVRAVYQDPSVPFLQGSALRRSPALAFLLSAFEIFFVVILHKINHKIIM